MKKYVIVGVTENYEKRYVKDTVETGFEWVKDHREATKICDYDLALIEWDYIRKYHSQGFKRIFVPIYDEDTPPWNEAD